jgi:hypothetical protein
MTVILAGTRDLKSVCIRWSGALRSDPVRTDRLHRRSPGTWMKKPRRNP